MQEEGEHAGMVTLQFYRYSRHPRIWRVQGACVRLDMGGMAVGVASDDDLMTIPIAFRTVISHTEDTCRPRGCDWRCEIMAIGQQDALNGIGYGATTRAAWRLAWGHFRRYNP